MLDGQPLGEYPELERREATSEEVMAARRRHYLQMRALAYMRDCSPLVIRRGPHC